MPEKDDDVRDLVSGIARTARHLYESGLGESFFGNISVLLRGCPLEGGSETYPVEMRYPDLEGAVLIITRAGSTMLGIASGPGTDAGIYRVERKRLRLSKGAGPPSSELASHLAIHSRLGLESSAVVHCHIGALLPVLEAMEPLPDMVRSVPALPPGSLALAAASADQAAPEVLLLWRGHGIVAVSRTLEGACGAIDRSVELARRMAR